MAQRNSKKKEQKITNKYEEFNDLYEDASDVEPDELEFKIDGNGVVFSWENSEGNLRYAITNAEINVDDNDRPYFQSKSKSYPGDNVTAAERAFFLTEKVYGNMRLLDNVTYLFKVDVPNKISLVVKAINDLDGGNNDDLVFEGGFKVNNERFAPGNGGVTAPAGGQL